MVELETKAYAKVNLHLEILNRRTDGYHNIFTLMASVDLFDLLKLTNIKLHDEHERVVVDIVPSGGEFAGLISGIPTEDNIISRAVRAYFRDIGTSGDVTISIEKNIPAGAGLGGGSSDAAAVLRLLNDYVKKMSDNELMCTASSVGADVPFCVRGGYAICEGIGDRVENIDGGINCWALIANNDIHVDTGKAYNALGRQLEYDLNLKEMARMKELMRKALKTGDLKQLWPHLKNDFEHVVFEEYPEIKMSKDLISEYNPNAVFMTGSGSSVVGLFEDYNTAKSADTKLRKSVPRVFFTKFL
jgi:4-diphosphocytidyl-2-C-methyl-D-erythritol kinase